MATRRSGLWGGGSPRIGAPRRNGVVRNGKGSGTGRSPLVTVHSEARLLNLRGEAAERAVQLGATAIHHGDDGNGDAGGDQAILDGRGARLVLHETRNEGLHSWLLSSTTGCLSVTQCPFAGLFGSCRNLIVRNCNAVKPTSQTSWKHFDGRRS